MEYASTICHDLTILTRPACSLCNARVNTVIPISIFGPAYNKNPRSYVHGNLMPPDNTINTVDNTNPQREKYKVDTV